MAAITEISPERKQSARLLALAYVLSWAFVFFTVLGLTIPAQAMEKLSPAPIWLRTYPKIEAEVEKRDVTC
jgi:aryl-alcohol dehydrogenase-like predicted oxidoreductase